ncbi:MAG: type II toxin-antitoxin system antitoxin SocA domain-containing protein [Patescibacteria group bacterium]
MLEKFIQQQRRKHNMTQEYLASELGMSRPTYMQIECGKREITVAEAEKLASIFDMTLENFLAGKDLQYKVTVTQKKQMMSKSSDLQIRVTEKNLEKFKQVFLYILGKVGSKPNIGETVLHKLLYFIDFDYYEKFEKNLIGATYIKNHHGPTAIELSSIVAGMQKSGEIEAVRSQYFKYGQKKYLPLKRPNLDLFSAQEIEHIDDVLARLSDKNAKEIENYSHEDIPWKVALDGKPLSYESVFYRDEKYSVRNYDDEL